MESPLHDTEYLFGPSFQHSLFGPSFVLFIDVTLTFVKRISYTNHCGQCKIAFSEHNAYDPLFNQQLSFDYFKLILSCSEQAVNDVH